MPLFDGPIKRISLYHPSPAGLAQFNRLLRGQRNCRHQRSGQRVRILAWHEEAGISEHFTNTAGIRCDHYAFASHRLSHHKSKSLAY